MSESSSRSGCMKWALIAAGTSTALCFFGSILARVQSSPSPASVATTKPASQPSLSAAQQAELEAATDAEMEQRSGVYRQTLADIRQAYRCEADKVDLVTRCSPPKAPRYSNSQTTVHARFVFEGEALSSSYLWLNYAGDDWIFWDNLTVRTGELVVDWTAPQAPERDHAGGTVGEYTAVVRDANLSLLLPVLAAEGETTLRFRGRFRSDHTLRGWEKASIEALALLAAGPPTREEVRAEIRSGM